MVLFHAKLATPFGLLATGGFLGVDVFFVISGYLITRIVFSEVAAGKFTFASFYERRVRRLLFPLLAVIAACMPFAYAILLPNEVQNFNKSVLTSIFFVSNIHFYLEDSYWATASSVKPLLHTWSLAVEEQFYLVFPAVYVFLARFKPKTVLVSLAAIALASFILALAALGFDRSFGFFMFPTRIWELLCGSLLGFAELHRKRPEASPLSRWISLAAVAAILGPVFFYQSNIDHPSIFTVVPVLGVAALIWFGSKDDPVTRVLSSKGLVWIGLISYSIYLWHWPLLVFGQLFTGSSSNLLKIGLAAASVPLSWFSYVFIERLSRDRRWLPARAFYATLIAGLAILLTTQAVVSNGISTTAPAYEPQPPATADAALCAPILEQTLASCRIVGEGEVTTIIWGDSHAGTMVTPVADPKEGEAQIWITHGGCPPFIGIAYKSYKDLCADESRGRIIAEAILQIRPKNVVLAARWNLYTHPQLLAVYKNWFKEGLEENGEAGLSQQHQIFRDSLKKTLDAFSSVPHVAIVGQFPDLSNSTNPEIQSGRIPRSQVDVIHPLEDYISSMPEEYPNVLYYDMIGELCEAEFCRTKDANGALYYRDNNHPSVPAASIFWTRFKADEEAWAEAEAPADTTDQEAQ